MTFLCCIIPFVTRKAFSDRFCSNFQGYFKADHLEFNFFNFFFKFYIFNDIKFYKVFSQFNDVCIIFYININSSMEKSQKLPGTNVPLYKNPAYSTVHTGTFLL